jgi:hypothetical protein
MSWLVRVAWEMILHKGCFNRYPDAPMVFDDVKTRYLTAAGVSLCKSMLAWSPSARVTATRALESPFLSPGMMFLSGTTEAEVQTARG